MRVNVSSFNSKCLQIFERVVEYRSFIIAKLESTDWGLQGENCWNVGSSRLFFLNFSFSYLPKKKIWYDVRRIYRHYSIQIIFFMKTTTKPIWGYWRGHSSWWNQVETLDLLKRWGPTSDPLFQGLHGNRNLVSLSNRKKGLTGRRKERPGKKVVSKTQRRFTHKGWRGHLRTESRASTRTYSCTPCPWGSSCVHRCFGGWPEDYPT